MSLQVAIELINIANIVKISVSWQSLFWRFASISTVVTVMGNHSNCCQGVVVGSVSGPVSSWDTSV